MEEEIIKSSNTKGNPYHKPGGSSDGGEFASAGEVAYNKEKERQEETTQNPNYKFIKLQKLIDDKVPFYLIRNNQTKRALKDYLMFTPFFEKHFSNQIIKSFPNFYKKMLSVKRKEDDIAGNDFFVFDNDTGFKSGIDLKSYAWNEKGTVQIRFMDTKEGHGYQKDFLIDSTKTNAFYAFMCYATTSQNVPYYEEKLNGGDPTKFIEDGYINFVSKRNLTKYFSGLGLNKTFLEEIGYKLKDEFEMVQSAKDKNVALKTLNPVGVNEYSFDGKRLVLKYNDNMNLVYDGRSAYIEMSDTLFEDVPDSKYYTI